MHVFVRVCEREREGKRESESVYPMFTTEFKIYPGLAIDWFES